MNIASLQSRLDESGSRGDGLQAEVTNLNSKLKDQELRNERLSVKLQQRYIQSCTCTCRVFCVECRVSWVRVPPEAAHFSLESVCLVCVV